MTTPRNLDKWRRILRSIGARNLFELIDYAIDIAATDYREEFNVRRDQIVERLFCCRLPACEHCNQVEDAPSIDVGSECIQGERPIPNESVAKHNEIEDDPQKITVSRIKRLLRNNFNEPPVLHKALMQLQSMPLNVNTLKATGIGKTVNELRKHKSQPIRNLSSLLITEWKRMVDEWYAASQSSRAVSEGTPQSAYPHSEEDGLPSPPLDGAVFFDTSSDGINLSQFFDGIDDDGNLKTNKGNRNRDSEPKQGKSKVVDEERKLEATKRKLNEGYEQAKRAKMQRTVQRMEVKDLPKQLKANKISTGRSALRR